MLHRVVRHRESTPGVENASLILIHRGHAIPFIWKLWRAEIEGANAQFCTTDTLRSAVENFELDLLILTLKW